MATPKLRFKEFDGDWTSKQLGKIIGVSSASRVFKEQWQEKKQKEAKKNPRENKKSPDYFRNRGS